MGNTFKSLVLGPVLNHARFPITVMGAFMDIARLEGCGVRFK